MTEATHSPIRANGDENNTLFQRRKEAPPPPSSTSDESLYLGFIEQLAFKHFSCAICAKLVNNPKVLTNASSTAASVCASCADLQSVQVTDAPMSLVGAAADIRTFLYMKYGDVIMSERLQKIVGKSIEARKATSPPLLEAAVSELNPNTDPPTRRDATPQKQLFVDATAAVIESPKRTKVEINPKHRAQLMLIIDEETVGRTAIIDASSTFHLETQRSYAARMKTLRAQRTGCSKQVKMEADEHYEKGNYAQAVQLYTKSISLVSDGTTRLNVLFGNRSAALFMAQDYERCVEDCLKVTQMEPTNVKLYSRAVKAAVMMGDLERAAQIHNLVDASIVTSQMQNEYNKIVQATDDLKEATKRHGTAEGDRMWERLMTKFSETHVFRMQLADSVAMQGLFSKAIDLLSMLVPPNRPPGVAYRIAKFRYMSGFEHFEAAKGTLQDFTHDAQCAKLLQLIRSVDEAKQDGNNLFASRSFAASVEQYTKAIDLDLNNGKILRILYCNRAAAYKELGKYQEGVEDCTKAIDLDPAFGKAYARRARCLMLQKMYDGASRDFRTALQYDPNDKEIARELKNAEDAVAKEIEKEKDFFYVLDIDSRSTDAEIKSKYRALCLRWHPDKNADKSADDKLVSERKFKAINEAYSTLSNPEKRREYELKRDRERYAARGGGFGDFMNRQTTATTATTGPTAAKYTRTRHASGTSAGTYGSNYASNFW